MDLATLPKTRKEAKELGAELYFTGKPCKHGHIAPRITKGACVICRELGWKKDNEVRKGKPKSEAAKLAGKRYYEKNKELIKRKTKAQDPDKVKQYKRKWKENNRDKVRIDTNIRRRRLRQASPKWLTSEDKVLIRAKYEDAARKTKETGIRYVVDHDLPLKGDKVCGLHVPDNLVVITFSANARKSNKY